MNSRVSRGLPEPFCSQCHRHSLAMAMEGTKQWYVEFLCLPGDGFVPGHGDRNFYPKSECRARMGSPSHLGTYPWAHRGPPSYERYVTELYERVCQKKLKRGENLPWHFVRGLLAEEDGEPVDWAEFAVSKRRGPGRRYPALRILPMYRNLRHPLPFKARKCHPPNDDGGDNVEVSTAFAFLLS